MLVLLRNFILYIFYKIYDFIILLELQKKKKKKRKKDNKRVGEVKFKLLDTWILLFN